MRYSSSKMTGFEHPQIARIQRRFNEYAEGGKMSLSNFKKSMGLLGIGDCELLSDRIFKLISQSSHLSSHQFVTFLDVITHGSRESKAKVSFDFLDRHHRGYISKEDIEVIIGEVSFAWNFLTGEKLSNSDCIEIICRTLGIDGSHSINFEEYLQVYDNDIEWFDYFNSRIKPVEQVRHPFNIDQLEQYLKLLHNELKVMITDLREGDETQEETNTSLEISEIKSLRGPTHINTQEFKPRGDADNPRQSLAFFRASTLSRDIEAEGSSKVEVMTKKLEQFTKISQRLFPQYHQQQQQQEQRGMMPVSSRSKKKTNVNITEPEKRKNIIYFGHEDWNLMLNMMLGIRKVLKSHFYKFDPKEEFTEEDYNVKYTHELIYKQHNKSVKEICELFVVYAPKAFFFIRNCFEVDKAQFLKSIGLESLIGNLLMGNLSSLTDQTSEGKNGSFIYYTEDARMIVKQISHEESRKMRSILPEYTEYVRENPDTYLPQIYGLFKLKNKLTNRQIYFIVINNIFATGLKIHERYDIKGSTHNRQAAKSGDHSINTALKDLDLMNNHQRVFSLPFPIREKIFKQIVKDSEFLATQNIIQYSLLVGVHQGRDQAESHTRAYESISGNQLFFFGIIDVLTEYSTKKAFQNHFMQIFTSDASCLPPADYSQRFKDFIYKYIFSTQHKELQVS